MRQRIVPCIAVFISALLQAACGSFPINPPLAKYDPSTGYRFNLPPDEGDKRDRLFVILVFSGGGTRAAALSYGVMEALRDTRIYWQDQNVSLLDEVDVISSISGGSFPAAYYALFGSKIFKEFPKKFLYRPVQSDLTRLALSPASWLKLVGSSFGRSDLAAEFYDREVFGGGTYADVIVQHKRPFVILNATDLSSGAQFPFIQDQFDLLCSDLAGVKIARAAAASSAFPGGLTPLTFQNYAGTCEYRQPRWVDLAVKDHKSRVNARRTALAERRVAYTDTEIDPITNTKQASRKYIHLTDGGVADNIGLREPLTAIAGTDSSWSVLRRINLKQVDKLVVIVVNAGTNPETQRDRTPKVPGLFDTVMTVATIPLDNYSFETLELLRATVNDFNEEMRLVSGCKELAAGKGPQCALDIPMPHHVEFFPVEVALEYIESDQDRNWFKNLPTSFELSLETVDKLREVGRKILREDPQFKKLLEEL
ncbi:MAG: patatin-like phospholipase family protein [Gammaproteobacteria bacterium]